MVATPLTRPPGSEFTTRPSTWVPRGAITLSSTTRGSASVAVKLSPVAALLVESSVSVRILMGVPAAIVTSSGLGGGAGASAFAGAASEAGVKPVTVDESARCAVATRHAGNQHAVGDHRLDDAAVAFFPLTKLCFPNFLAGLHVQRSHITVNVLAE